VPCDDPLAAKASVRLADLAAKPLLQHAATVPESFAMAAPEQRWVTPRSAVRSVEDKLEHVAAGEGLVVLPRSTTTYYRRPDVRVVPIEDIGPSRVTLIWDASKTDPERDAFVAAAIACKAQTI
jgi:DNA-binding transcriptional LysR family regulator